ncbi:hypothetical protein ACOSQ4_019516 [Xanthoceras sorbifolium]
MANERTQEKSKAIWDPRTHEIWVDLAIKQIRARNRNRTHLKVECSNRKEKRLEPNRKKFKKGKRNNSAKLSNQLKELCESIKSRSPYIRTDPPGCSDVTSPLFKLGISSFAKKVNSEIFVALREPEYQIQWLKDQQY